MYFKIQIIRMQKPPAAVCTRSRDCGMRKVSPIVSKLTHIQLASDVGNTNLTTAIRSIAFIFENMILICDNWQVLLRRSRTVKTMNRGNTLETFIYLNISEIVWGYKRLHPSS